MKKLIVLFCSVLFVGSVLVSNAQADTLLEGKAKYQLICPDEEKEGFGIKTKVKADLEIVASAEPGVLYMTIHAFDGEDDLNVKVLAINHQLKKKKGKFAAGISTYKSSQFLAFKGNSKYTKTGDLKRLKKGKFIAGDYRSGCMALGKFDVKAVDEPEVPEED